MKFKNYLPALIFLLAVAGLMSFSLVKDSSKSIKSSDEIELQDESGIKIYQDETLGKFIINPEPELKGWSEEFIIAKFENLTWVTKVKFEAGDMYVYFVDDYNDLKIRQFARDYLDLED